MNEALCLSVGMLAAQSAELAQASGTSTCSDTPGPTLFLCLATVLFVQQMWTETKMSLIFMNIEQMVHNIFPIFPCIAC